MFCCHGEYLVFVFSTIVYGQKIVSLTKQLKIKRFYVKNNHYLFIMKNNLVFINISLISDMYTHITDVQN